MKFAHAALCLFPFLAAAADTVYVHVPAPAPASVPQTYPGYHRHDGFFLSMNPGLGYGRSVLRAHGSDATADKIVYTGFGGPLDFKIGGAVMENLILSFDLLGFSVQAPDLNVDGESITSPNSFSVSDFSMGIGLTYYFMPANILVSGTFGMGQISLREEDADLQLDTRKGPAFHAKIGKEWWVSKNWGLGVAGGYGIIVAKDDVPAYADYEGTRTSQKFYVLFNTTYN